MIVKILFYMFWITTFSQMLALNFRILEKKWYSRRDLQHPLIDEYFSCYTYYESKPFDVYHISMLTLSLYFD